MVRPLNAIGVPRGPEARAGGEHEKGDEHPSHKGGSGVSPNKIFKFKMSVEAILLHFETIRCLLVKFGLLYRHFM